MAKLVVPLITACLLFASVAAGVVTHAGEALVMHRLASATGADGALNWSAGSDPCAWLGVTCNDLGRVYNISVNGVGLNGSLPSDLGGFSSLLTLDVRSNRLTGPLPRLWSVPLLSTLRLDNNSFTEVPRGFFSSVRALRHFSASNNTRLQEWELPRYVLRRLTRLVSFEVDNAGVTGTVVDFLGDNGDGAFSLLERISMANNDLSGPIPDKFASQRLQYLDLHQNHLSGPITSLCNLVSLVELRVDGNEFTGPLPDFTSMKKLLVLFLADNRLTGAVPASLTGLEGLQSVTITGNFLQGPLPRFASIVRDDVDAAAANGSFCRLDYGPCDPRVDMLLSIAAGFNYPEVLARSWRRNDPCHGWDGVYCGNGGEVKRLNLCRMGLNGTMTPAFGSLTSLVDILISGNNVTGVIPSSVAKLPSLRLLDVSDNELEGTMPVFRSDVEIWSDGNPKLNKTSVTSCSPPPSKAFSVAGVVAAAFLVFYFYGY